MLVQSPLSTVYTPLATQNNLTQLNTASYGASGTDEIAETGRVIISGKASVLSRLLHTTESGITPPVKYQQTWDSDLPQQFLTYEDRDLLAKIYEYAQQKGIDLLRVDGLAIDLGLYRAYGSENGLPESPIYHFDGRRIIPQFSDEEEAIAQQIYTSRAFKDTEIDHGFLQLILNPMRLSVHVVDFDFLKEVIFSFSASGSDGSQDPNASPVVRKTEKDYPVLTPEEMGISTGKTATTAKTTQTIETALERLDRLLETIQKHRPGSVRILSLLQSDDKAALSSLYERLSRDKLSEDKVEEKVAKLAFQLGAKRLLAQLVEGLMGKERAVSVDTKTSDSKLPEPYAPINIKA